MKHLIIPDVHDKIEIVERILDQESFDQLTFLGDFFDDFTTGVKEAEQTARRVKSWLDQGICLLGNHDLCYGWGRWNAGYMCSGFTQPKAKAIHSVLDWQDWKKFKLHCWVEGETPWLITHAGFHKAFHRPAEDLRAVVDWRCEQTLKSLHGPVEIERGRGHSLLWIGQERGGRQPYGGILWCDCEMLDPPAGVNQLCGHTPRDYVREKSGPGYRAMCIDTNLRYYAVLEEGHLTVKAVAGT